MGVKRLKIKDELNYRPGPTSGGCGDCNHFVGEFPIVDSQGVVTAHEPRCRVIGLGGRQFKINPEYICDRFDNSEKLARIRGADWNRRLRTNANFRQPHR
jgi:hypothetical protein